MEGNLFSALLIPAVAEAPQVLAPVPVEWIPEPGAELWPGRPMLAALADVAGGALAAEGGADVGAEGL